MNDSEIRTLVARLGRPDSAGRIVIERAAIQAAGVDAAAVIEWIMTHSGSPEAVVSSPRSHGLHGSRVSAGTDPTAAPTLRFVLPAEVLV